METKVFRVDVRYDVTGDTGKFTMENYRLFTVDDGKIATAVVMAVRFAADAMLKRYRDRFRDAKLERVTVSPVVIPNYISTVDVLPGTPIFDWNSGLKSSVGRYMQQFVKDEG